jgi:hypothetical protein
MFATQIIAGPAVVAVLFSLFAESLSERSSSAQSSSAQSSSNTPGSFPGLEFPAVISQNVVAGTTPVGTKIRAKLAVATLVNGVVVPRDAILSGEIVESVAKTASGPSRLAVFMESAQWKGGAAPTALRFNTKLYLTAWYYPQAPLSPYPLSAQAGAAASLPSTHGNGVSNYPNPTYRAPNAPSSRPFPSDDADRNGDPSSPASGVSQHRVLMKDVESARSREGAVTLTSTHSNIKLNKTTTYVFAAGVLPGGPG